MRIKSGRYWTRGGWPVDIIGVSLGWAYAASGSGYNWWYEDTGQSAVKSGGWFGGDDWLVEREQ